MQSPGAEASGSGCSGTLDQSSARDFVAGLKIDLNPCSGLTSVDELGKRECPAQLKELKICFSECSGSTSVDGLGKGTSQLRQLTELEIVLSFCFAFTSVDKLGKGISS